MVKLKPLLWLTFYCHPLVRGGDLIQSLGNKVSVEFMMLDHEGCFFGEPGKDVEINPLEVISRPCSSGQEGEVALGLFAVVKCFGKNDAFNKILRKYRDGGVYEDKEFERSRLSILSGILGSVETIGHYQAKSVNPKVGMESIPVFDDMDDEDMPFWPGNGNGNGGSSNTKASYLLCLRFQYEGEDRPRSIFERKRYGAEEDCPVTVDLKKRLQISEDLWDEVVSAIRRPKRRSEGGTSLDPSGREVREKVFSPKSFTMIYVPTGVGESSALMTPVTSLAYLGEVRSLTSLPIGEGDDEMALGWADLHRSHHAHKPWNSNFSILSSQRERIRSQLPSLKMDLESMVFAYLRNGRRFPPIWNSYFDKRMVEAAKLYDKTVASGYVNHNIRRHLKNHVGDLFKVAMKHVYRVKQISETFTGEELDAEWLQNPADLVREYRPRDGRHAEIVLNFQNSGIFGSALRSEES